VGGIYREEREGLKKRISRAEARRRRGRGKGFWDGMNRIIRIKNTRLKNTETAGCQQKNRMKKGGAKN
jgi:hypothetical protein